MIISFSASVTGINTLLSKKFAWKINDLSTENLLDPVLNYTEELEEHFGTKVNQADRVSKLEKCREKAPLILEVVNKEGNWARLQDSAVHLGTWYTDGLKATLKDLGTSQL